MISWRSMREWIKPFSPHRHSVDFELNREAWIVNRKQHWGCDLELRHTNDDESQATEGDFAWNNWSDGGWCSTTVVANNGGGNWKTTVVAWTSRIKFLLIFGFSELSEYLEGETKNIWVSRDTFSHRKSVEKGELIFSLGTITLTVANQRISGGVEGTLGKKYIVN